MVKNTKNWGSKSHGNDPVHWDRFLPKTIRRLTLHINTVQYAGATNPHVADGY